ncbi:hypothetical protein F1880_001728 [Penicillium rolfsii]|nr:hypothetical protein F1880_001728 [Penicillium rolfsii]
MSENKKNIKADEGQQLPRARRAWFSSTSLIKILIAVLSMAILLWTIRRPLYRGFAYSFSTEDADDADLLAEPSSRCPHINSPDSRCILPNARYNVKTGITACYPSSGGIWLANIGPVELQYLGINRFDSTERSWNKAEEDHFCHELRTFGGSWYNPKSPDDLWVGSECRELDEFEPVLSIDRRVAFPEKGGVLVLVIDERTGRFPLEMAGVRNSLTMEERSMMLERLGAVYCDDVPRCPILDDLNKEPRDLADDREASLIL